jgi:hypothetical protein
MKIKPSNFFKPETLAKLTKLYILVCFAAMVLVIVDFIDYLEHINGMDMVYYTETLLFEFAIFLANIVIAGLIHNYITKQISDTTVAPTTAKPNQTQG